MPVSTKPMPIRWLMVAFFGLVMVSMASCIGVQETTIHTIEGKEKIRVDPDKKEEEIYLPKVKFWMLNDYKRGQTVFKTSMTGTQACYLTKLDRSKNISPRVLARLIKNSKDLQHDIKAKLTKVKYELVISEEEVRDISSLSERARTLCKGLKVFRLVEKAKKGGMQKRFFFFVTIFAPIIIIG